MASFNDIATSLRVTTQLPLDHKRFAVSQLTLSDLGDSNNLAYTYYDNLKVFCWNEKTEWVWREVQIGEENTGLIPSDFLYPNGVVYPNPGYEGKKYNFFQIVTGTDTKITGGISISVTGNGSALNPYVINSSYVYVPLPADLSPVVKVDEGNGPGYVIRDRDPANFGNVGLGAFDLTTHATPSTTHGATGAGAFAVGDNIVANAINSVTFGKDLSNIGSYALVVGKGHNSSSGQSIVTGLNNVAGGRLNNVFGIAHNVNSLCTTVIGQAANIIVVPSTDFNNQTTKPLLLVGNGTVDNITELATARSDAFIVRYNGVIEAPTMTIAQITAGTVKTLVTKEYVTSVVSPRPYKEYATSLSQTGTANPVMSNGNLALQNELSGPIVWTRTGIGSYAGTLVGAFASGKTICLIENTNLGTNVVFTAARGSNDTITVKSFFNDTLTDAMLSSTGLMIRVYN